MRALAEIGGYGRGDQQHGFFADLVQLGHSCNGFGNRWSRMLELRDSGFEHGDLLLQVFDYRANSYHLISYPYLRSSAFISAFLSS
jgi:hypothetical protein